MERRRAPAALWLLALSVGLRIVLLNARSLWFDETATLYISRMPWSEIAAKVAALEENPPLHYLAMHLWTPLFPDAVLAMRLFSALCGMASLFVFWALCRRLIPRETDMALFLAAVSSFWIHFAQDGRIYGLLLLLGLISYALFLSLDERWAWELAVLYGAASLAGLYTHNFFAFTLLAQAAWLVLKKRRLGRWAVVFGAVGLLYAPWLRVVVSQIKLLERASVLSEPLTLRNLCYVLGTMVVDTSFLSFAHVRLTVLLGAAALGAAAAAAWSWRRSEACLFCVVQILVPFAALRVVEGLSGRPATQARYLIVASPFLYILLAQLLEKPLNGLGRWARLACAVVFAGGTVAYFTGAVYADPHLPALADALRKNTGPGDVIVYLDPYYYLPMRYYYLPERTQRLAGPDAKIANWEGLPGYPSYIPRDELSALKKVVVVDPRHVMFAARVGVSAGSDVAKAAYP